jgi:predicted O-linked N-acetylglucosamine transferase (SPINDLY family)
VVGLNFMPLAKGHGHDHFEILCYAGVERPDGITEKLRQWADQWRNTAGLLDEALAEMIRSDGVDILVDLTQHLAGNRLPLFARKPAPVQVSFAGYPESTGLEAIRYRISDRWLESQMEVRRSEMGSAERVYLIESFWCYAPCGMELPVQGLPAQETGRITFGCLNHFCKVNDSLLQLWARVLKAVHDSRLVILSSEGSHRQRTWEFLAAEGIESHRVKFVSPRPRKEYFELYHDVDIVLDTFPYNGHTTSLDALWMGVPVVSLCGERPVSRAGLSQLSNLGLPELVAFTGDQYVEIAAGLANDIPRLKELRATLRPRMEKSVLMDGAHFARQIEACYRSMWREWCADQKSIS